MPILDIDLNRPFIWLKIAQFLMGIICYALYFSQVWSSTKHTVVLNIESVAAVAYPFVVIPVILLTSFLQGEGLTGHLICVLFSGAGFIACIAAGSATVAKFGSAGSAAAGAICIIYSFLFLGDVLWYGYEKYFRK